MSMVDNLNRSTLEDLFRRIRALEAGSPMNNSAIGSGGIEVYDGGTINVSNGNLIVNGTATIGGTLAVTGLLTQAGTTRFTGQTFIYGPLEVTGDVNLDGTTDVTGAFNVTGPTKLNGTTTIGGDTTVTGNLDVTGPMATKGTLSVEGVTTLKSDLNVTTGKVKVGDMTMSQAGGIGKLDFNNGASVSSNGAGVVVKDSSGSAGLDLSVTAKLTGQGSSVIASGTGIQLNGPYTTVSGQLIVNNKPLAPAGKTANVYWDTSDNTFKLIP